MLFKILNLDSFLKHTQPVVDKSGMFISVLKLLTNVTQQTMFFYQIIVLKEIMLKDHFKILIT